MCPVTAAPDTMNKEIIKCPVTIATSRFSKMQPGRVSQRSLLPALVKRQPVHVGVRCRIGEQRPRAVRIVPAAMDTRFGMAANEVVAVRKKVARLGYLLYTFARSHDLVPSNGIWLYAAKT